MDKTEKYIVIFLKKKETYVKENVNHTRSIKTSCNGGHV